jgi:hypothetical protein
MEQNFRIAGQFQATQQIAERMLSKRIIVEKECVITGVEVRVTRPASEDKRLFWEKPDVDPTTGEETKREYFIANTNIMSGYNAEQAIELFENEMYQDAINKGMSKRVSPEEAAKIELGLGKCSASIGWFTNKDGIEALRIEKLQPIAPEKPVAFTFDFSKKKKEAADALAAANMAAFEEENVKAAASSPEITAKKPAAAAMAEPTL